MGRLFWKFLAVFWLAQMAISVVMGLMLFAWSPDEGHGPARPPEAYAGEPGPHGHGDAHKPGRGLPPPPMLAAALLVSLVSAAWLSWYFSHPIRNLNAAFDALANGQLDARVGNAMGSRRDELADLGHAFDRSADKLQTQVDTQRRLLHDVSHELRSPLARLQACSDLMVQQPQRAAELVQRIERETGRMDALVGEILTLARLSSGVQPLRKVTVDVGELLHTLGEDVQLELESKGCTLDLRAPDALSLQGDGEMLYRALDNILRNAIRYAPAGSEISIRAHAQAAPRQAVMEIADRGPGVPQQDLATIFEPFYRSLRASSQPAAEGHSGYGLGLAITRSIVQAHGGAVIAENRSGGGLLMRITLPL